MIMILSDIYIFKLKKKKIKEGANFINSNDSCNRSSTTTTSKTKKS